MGPHQFNVGRSAYRRPRRPPRPQTDRKLFKTSSCRLRPKRNLKEKRLSHDSLFYWRYLQKINEALFVPGADVSFLPATPDANQRIVCEELNLKRRVGHFFEIGRP